MIAPTPVPTPAEDPWPTDVATHRTDLGLRAIVQGVGAVRERLAAEVRAEGARRPMIVCGAQVVHSPAFAGVNRALTDGLGVAPLVFDGSRPHSPSDAIEAAAARARAEGVDALVAVGGSSSIDTAKGIAVLLATGTQRVSSLTPPAPGALAAPSVAAPGVVPFPVLTVTTTLSYAEFYPFWGTRLVEVGAKRGYGDHGAVRRTIFLDGEIAACTPDLVWFETAVKSLDDALLVHLRSRGTEPFLDPLLVAGIRGVVEHLASSRGAARAVERQRVLGAMALTKFAAPRLRTGFDPEWFARAVRYALGSRYGLPHGAGTCVALLRGLAFHRPTTEARRHALADALGVGDDELEGVFDRTLTAAGVPRTLDDLGVAPAQLDEIADDIVTSMPGLGTRAAVHAAVADLFADGPVSSRP